MLGFEARLLKKLGFLIWKHIHCKMCARLLPRIRCHDLRQWIRCQSFWMIFGKRKGMTTNLATRPFWEVAGSGIDDRGGTVFDSRKRA